MLAPGVIVLILSVGCQNDEPLPTHPGDRDTAAPATAEQIDKSACPDLDEDSFSPSTRCTQFDCNDDRYYISHSGYCDLHPYLRYNTFPEFHNQVADFGVAFHDEAFHIFFTTGFTYDEHVSLYLGHVTSLDGDDWILQPPSLAIDPDSDWDDAHIWAPCIVKNPDDDLYYMFYTGVTDGDEAVHHEERIGLAVSTDLFDWERVDCFECEGVTSPGCVLQGDAAWTGWQSSHYNARQGRDPHVFWDAAADYWYMVYSTMTSDMQNMVVGLAKSKDMLRWSDCGPIGVTVGAKAESAHVLQMDETYYLFWTIHDDGGIAYASNITMEGGRWTSPDVLEGSFEDFRLASEAFYAGNWPVFAYIREFTRDFRFRRLEITPTGTLQTADIPPLNCRWYGADKVHPGAEEVPNGIDDNCNGLVDEIGDPCVDNDGDGFGRHASLLCHGRGGDCDDFDEQVYPGALGHCNNGVDDDCNGLIDDSGECDRPFDHLSRY